MIDRPDSAADCSMRSTESAGTGCARSSPAAASAARRETLNLRSSGKNSCVSFIPSHASRQPAASSTASASVAGA
ncbi:hypothetical protein G6F63_016491 [Rhizopus arrhizus]|nr:hypothetical protein G6F63_016491 [Rhizopus arrhizus]